MAVGTALSRLGRIRRLHRERARVLARCNVMAAALRTVNRTLLGIQVRVSAIWKRHPEFTARQILRNLKPQDAVPASLVQKVMRQCWRGSARRSPAQRLTGGGFIALGGV